MTRSSTVDEHTAKLVHLGATDRVLFSIIVSTPYLLPSLCVRAQGNMILNGGMHRYDSTDIRRGGVYT